LAQRYDHVINTLTEYKDAMEIMTRELLDVEVITGERVREIIKQTGKEIYEGGDLHQDGTNNL
jgi:cell division protease FtsH